MVNTGSSKVTRQQQMNQSGNPIDVDKKDIQVIDISESEEELVTKQQQMNQSCNPTDVDKKDIQVIDISESYEELVTRQQQMNQSGNPIDVDKKDIHVIDPVSVTRKRKRLIQSGLCVNKNVDYISSSDDESVVALSNKKNVDSHIQKDETMEFDDEAPISFSRSTNKHSTSIYKSLTLRLIDEDIDEEFDTNKSIDIVADDVQKNDKSNKTAP
ncbi:hypothetical protein Tco_1378758 [Tanacetum coccineum]